MIRKSLIVFLGFFFAFVYHLECATIYVDASNIDGDDDGTSWSTAYRYLQDAISEASSSDEIRVAEGNYYPDEGDGHTNNNYYEVFLIPSGVALYGGYPQGGGTRDFKNIISILSGEIQQNGNKYDNSRNIIKIDGVNDQTIIDGFTLEKGYNDYSNPSTNYHGAAINIINNSHPTIKNCTFQNNYGIFGGVIFSLYSSPLIQCCIFKNNQANTGGVFYNYGEDDSYLVQNCIFWNNSAVNKGGVVFNSYRSSPTFSNCTFYDNSCDGLYGGQLFYLDNGYWTTHVYNCIFEIPTNESRYYNPINPASGHNIVFYYNNFNPEPFPSVGGSYSIFSDPLFQDPDNGNFYLEAGSPCMNYGWNHNSNQYVPDTDFDGRSRPLPASDAHVDLGVYEQYSDGTLPITLSSFSASLINSAATLCWTTQSENNNMAWNAYRGESEDFASVSILNYDLIAGAGTSTTPVNYSFADPEELVPGSTYCYWLEAISFSGESDIFGPIMLSIPNDDPGQNTPAHPETNGLHHNYPNPFNPSTTISFTLTTEMTENTELVIYNLNGQKIKQLVSEQLSAGQHSVIWNGTDENNQPVSSGIYFYKLNAGEYEKTKKMILMK